MPSKAKVAIGPAVDLPSWNWIGPDLAAALGAHYEVEIFGEGELPRCDVAVLVKQRGPLDGIRRALADGTRIVYAPVDFYPSARAIRRDAWFLGACAAVVSHSERLSAYLAPHARHVWPIDHHDKYSLPEPAPYRSAGPVLWIGDFRYVPYVLAWAARTPPPVDLVLLTNVSAARWRATVGLAALLGVRLRQQGNRLNGHVMHEWSPALQADLMRSAKAAVDIKGRADFNQLTKPPTKAQKFVMSGIPFACNEGSSPESYFAARGFRLARPDDFERWLSLAYWEETAQERGRLREDLALPTIAARMRGYLDRVLGEPPPRAPPLPTFYFFQEHADPTPRARLRAVVKWARDVGSR